jgi:ATP-binding cassette subfamily B (MDR/TAP) protein 1
MGDRFEAENDLNEDAKDELVLDKKMSEASGVEAVEEVKWKNKGFFGSFGIFLVEQKKRWPWYLLLTAGCAGGACKFVTCSSWTIPVLSKLVWKIIHFLGVILIFHTAANSLQAWFFSQLLNVVTIVDGTLQAAVNHWSLLFFVLGIGSGIAYFTLGYSSNQISVVSTILSLALL